MNKDQPIKQMPSHMNEYDQSEDTTTNINKYDYTWIYKNRYNKYK